MHPEYWIAVSEDLQTCFLFCKIHFSGRLWVRKELWPGRHKITSKTMSPLFRQESQTLPVLIWNHRCIQQRKRIKKTLSMRNHSVPSLSFWNFKALKKKKRNIYIYLQQMWYWSWEGDRSIITDHIFKGILGHKLGIFKDIHTSGKTLDFFPCA